MITVQFVSILCVCNRRVVYFGVQGGAVTSQFQQ